MNRKQFIVLLVLVVLVGAAGWIVRQRGQGSWHSAGPALGRKLLPDFPVNDVAQITIQSGTNELHLARRDNFWRVRERGDYPADFSGISGLLLKFADLKIVQSQAVGAAQLGRFELLPPGPATNAGTLVEFKNQDGKTINTVLLGKQHLKQPPQGSGPGGPGDEGWPDGRYVMVGRDAKALAVISDPLDNVQPKPEAWLNKDFLRIENPRAISVQFAEATNSWKLTRVSATNDWQLADARAGEKPDPDKLSGATGPFNSPSFNDVSPANTRPDAFSPANVTVLTVETFDGFTYTAKIGRKQDDNYPITFSIAATLPSARAAANDEKPEDKAKLDAEFKDRQKQLAEKLTKEKQFENWIYYVPDYVVDPVLKTKDQLLAETPKNALPKSEK